MVSRTILAPEEIDKFREIDSRDKGYGTALLRLYYREGAEFPYLASALSLRLKQVRRRVNGTR